jgi:hypothetical protein
MASYTIAPVVHIANNTLVHLLVAPKQLLHWIPPGIPLISLVHRYTNHHLMQQRFKPFTQQIISQNESEPYIYLFHQICMQVAAATSN